MFTGKLLIALAVCVASCSLVSSIPAPALDAELKKIDDDSVSLSGPGAKKAPAGFEYHTKAAGASGAPVDEEAGAKEADEMIKTIAFNSREVRLMGPNQKEVEMRDDVGTKVMIALDNLGKEATEVWGTVNKEATQVWGQVNEKLDKGWTELKSMVEGVIAPSSKKTASGYISY